MLVCRAGTWHVVRAYCELGEVGTALLWSQAEWGSKPLPAADPLGDGDLGQGTYLSEPRFLQGH